jgi:hypothetical protein
MYPYIKNRILLEKQAVLNNCEGGDLDEKYQGALWDWAGNILNDIPMNETLKDELHTEIYGALSITFNTLYKGV